MRTIRLRALVALVLLAAVSAGCGQGSGDSDGSGSGGPARKSELPPAAEPSAAPEPARPPVGRVVPVGPIAEGLVADPETNLLAVGLREPYRLALVDTRSGSVRREVRLPGHLRHLQLRAPGGPVLVPAESADQLLEVELPSGEVTARVGVGEYPHDATATDDGAVLVADEFGGTVSVIEGDRVVHTFDDATQPGGVAAVGEKTGMVDVRENTLSVYDVPARKRIAELPAGEGPTHVVADKHGRLAVVDTRGGAIGVYELEPESRRVARLELPGGPYGVTYDSTRDRIWVTLTARNEVVAIDMSTFEPRIEQRFPTIRQPNTVAVNDVTGRIFVASPTEGALELIDP